ncbi:MAG: hypothetical protein IPJ34_35990 [Myxococcales bacterium]|nr:hypothetical protein [Myxococcales bacterium]
MGQPPAGAVPFGTVSAAQTFSVRTLVIGSEGPPAVENAPPSLRYGAVPCW